MAIFCSQCGAENNQNAVSCYHCQSPIARPTYDTDPRGPDPHRSNPHVYVDDSVDDSFEESRGQSPRRFQLRMGSMVIGAICVIYLLNPTAGFLEFIPDNIPIIGNLDEAAAVTGLLMALSNLGIIPYRRT